MTRLAPLLWLSLLSGCAMNTPTAMLLELDTEDPLLQRESLSLEILVRSGAELELTEREVIDGVEMPLQILLVPANDVAANRLIAVDLLLYDGPNATGYEMSRRELALRYQPAELSRIYVVFEPPD